MRTEYFFEQKQDGEIGFVNCGYEDCAPGFYCAPHVRSHYLVHYVVSGEGFLVANQTKYAIKQEQIFVIYPNTLISYSSPSQPNAWSVCWIGFSGQKSEDYLKMVGITPETPVIDIAKGDDLYRIIMNCVHYFSSTSTRSVFKLLEYIYACYYCFEPGGTDTARPKAERSAKSVYFEKAINYIQYNFTNFKTIKDVVNYLNIDRSYLFRIFKAYVNISPEAYLIDCRLSKSKAMLAESDYNIGEIAKRVGINDQYYFSKLFKSKTGLSPRQYRKSMQQKGEK